MLDGWMSAAQLRAWVVSQYRSKKLTLSPSLVSTDSIHVKVFNSRCVLISELLNDLLAWCARLFWVILLRPFGQA